MEAAKVQANLREIAEQFAKERGSRQLRRELVRADFDQIKAAGFLLTGVPIEQGGLWESTARSTRPICEMLRTLAQGDSSVALVCSMHPAVLLFWLATSQVPPAFQDKWEKQRHDLCQTAAEGAWWGTVASEPGSGGDLTKSKANAQLDPRTGSYLISGHKHFGSGTGIADYMLTTALPAAESRADWFYLDMRGIALDGSQGVKLTVPWDAHGMIATQSHALFFENFPATRIAWPDNINKVVNATNSAAVAYFGAVMTGIVETAIATARQKLEPKFDALSAFEQVEWIKVQQEAWLVEQAYEGMLRAIESSPNPVREVLLAKTAISEMAEAALGRLCRVIGGSAFGRNSPFGFWFEDVRAMGFLRPPWALLYDSLIKLSSPPKAK